MKCIILVGQYYKLSQGVSSDVLTSTYQVIFYKYTCASFILFIELSGRDYFSEVMGGGSEYALQGYDCLVNHLGCLSKTRSLMVNITHIITLNLNILVCTTTKLLGTVTLCSIKNKVTVWHFSCCVPLSQEDCWAL